MKDLMISVSGVRGVIGQSLTPDVVSKFSSSFGNYAKGGTVVVGRDTRISGSLVEHSVFAGLTAVGCNVLYIGIASTPTVQLAIKHYNAAGGIAITASHNPNQWNALKFMNNSGKFLDAVDGDFVKDLVTDDKINYSTFDKLGSIEKVGSFDDKHLDAVLNLDIITNKNIQKKKFKVVIDCVNGTASFIIPKLLNELGCEVVKLNCEPNGYFPREPEPIPENIKLLCEAVKENKADIGFAFDPDGDRLAIVDNNGNPIGEDMTLVMALELVFMQTSGTAATNVSTTALVDFVAKKYDCNIIRSKVGEANVVSEMVKNECIIGGEGNGGVIYPTLHYGRDAILATAMTLQLMFRKNESVSEIVDKYPKFFISKKKVGLGNNNLSMVLKKIEKETQDAKIDKIDGLKLLFPNNSWVHLRASNTEPIIRVISESNTQKNADELSNLYLNKIETM